MTYTGTDHERHTDVCIIGAGPAGLTVAQKLVQSGADVVLVESGDWNPSLESTRLAEGENVGYPYFALEQARQRGVTGSALRWSSFTRFRPLDPIDFEERASIPYSGWPFSIDHLQPYYERAHEILPLGPPNYSVEYWANRNGERPLLPIPDDEFETAVFESIQGRDGQASLVQIGNELAERIITNTTVTQLIANSDGTSIDSVTLARLDGHRSTLRARVFVLAAGGIDNARLMLLSNDKWARGVGNQNDLVGRFFMEHPGMHSSLWLPSRDDLVDQIGFYGPQVIAGTRIMTALTASQNLMRDEGLLNASILLRPSDDLRTSDVYRSMAALSWKGFRPGRWPLKRYGRDLGHIFGHPVRTTSTVLGLFNNRFPKRRTVIELDFTAEQAPNPDSRVTLGSERDALGQPRARLEWRLSDLDMWSIRRTQELLSGTLQGSGLGILEKLLGDESPPVRIFGQRHHMGTTRMHDNPKKGVVDSNARVHGLKNLYVTGSSVFPTSGYANPTLTIIALALRLTDHIDQVLHRRMV